MLEKTFDPKSAEPRLYEAWEKSGLFSPEAVLARNPDAEPFTVVIPPPNVTGSLHIGHALNNTLQDVLTRFERMRGKAALWVPGTDHAGIATQMVVERQLAAEGNISRRDMGREAFVERVWRWKAESAGTIQQQLRRLGASCDWSRERFTLDEGLSAAVRKVFVRLYKDGLIYRDKRLVNWDPHFQTAISDLEVEQKDVDGAYWHFAYPLEDGSGEIVVATTRPETMLGDTAVAVHPDDERYADLVGRFVVLPIAGRRIPIVADSYADPEKGSGAVKITPAHDFNDFQVGKRHNLPLVNMFDPQARLLDRFEVVDALVPATGDAPSVEIAAPQTEYRAAEVMGERADTRGSTEVVERAGFGDLPEDLRGLDRFAARKAVVAQMEALGFLRGVEKTRHAVPHGDRSGVPIEPYLTDQWYVRADILAQPAIAAVEQERTVFEPRNWAKTYFEWMRNIEPWCVSRQLWWGHRIPAWYDPEGFTYVEETEEEARAAARARHGRDIELAQDEDVLDTWFSSGLWPFSTMGWPEDTEDLRRFYPTSTLVTAPDIIFFWVARMMMMGLHFAGDIPFDRVFITALVRDEKGQKMSKSKGNVIDPLVLMDQYGTDALRFTLVAMSSGGRDIKLSEQRIAGYRNFGTKLWNAARFCQMNECRIVESFDPGAMTLPLNRWIRGETVNTAAAVTRALEDCAFDAAAEALYRFIWNNFCDWWLELAKPVLNGADEAAKAETRATAAWVIDQALKLLHPVSPYLTEELWAQMAAFSGVRRETMLIAAPWPELPAEWVDGAAAEEMDWLVRLVTEVRSIRSEMNVPPSAKPVLTLVGADAAARQRLEARRDLILTLARLADVTEADAPPPGAAQFVIGRATGAIGIAEFIDVAAERARLAKEIAGHSSDAERTRRKLDNPDFVGRAPEAVVEENREKLAAAEAARAKLEGALARLEAVS
ncbi:MAG TPA: valine--tRNA ligase [Caulobacteraceae bacterium]|jgi:valyl-tRNA synthetase